MDKASLYLGDFSPKTWRRLSLILIVQFLGMLLLAWLVRSPNVSHSVPFQNVISTLGKGRAEHNLGAWVFLACFCTFGFLLVPWHLNVARKVWHVNRYLAGMLAVVGLVSAIGTACVGIFDEHAMGPVSEQVSRWMHGFGAASAFGGHSIGAFLTWLVFAAVYLRAPAARREQMAHPLKLLVSVLLLGLVLICADRVPGYRQAAIEQGWGDSIPVVLRFPFWQWSLMLALMHWLFAMHRWFPDTLAEEAATAS